MIRAICIVCLLGGTALAVAPPHPDADIPVPVALERWPGPRPGASTDPARLTRANKAGLDDLRLLVIPAGFSDLAGAITPSSLQSVFTGSNSVRDYWLEVSGGVFTMTGEVVAWQRAPQTRSYYEGDANGLDVWAAPNNAGRFVLDVVTAADQAGLDWGRYDNDGPDGIPNSGDDDGIVDGLVVLHAGRGGECGTNELWSHQFFLAGWGYGRFRTSTPRTGGGFIEVDDYVLAPERSCKSSVIEIGVVCHELGHLLGLPDLYDTRQSRAGIGGWGLMGTGAWGGDGLQPASPSWPCAWSRDQLGWCDVADVRQDGDVTLAVGDVLRVRDPDQPAGESWLIENRLRVGFDASLPAGGLLVWHIDDQVIADTRHLNEVNAGPVLGVALEQADGFPHLQIIGGNRGDAGDPWPGSSGASVFSGTTLPHSHDNLDRFTDVALRQIPSPRTPVTFRVELGVTHLDVTPPDVTIVAPAGGEAWTLGNLHTVQWQATDDEDLAGLELWLSADDGATWPRRLASDLQDDNSLRSALSSQPGEQFRVRLIAHDATGNQTIATSNTFALRDRYAPGVAFSCDVAEGTNLRPGQTVLLTWDTADNVGVAAVDIELSCDGGLNWGPTSLTDQAPSAAALMWTVPDLACDDGRLRAVARDAAGNLGWDQSSAFFILGSTTDAPDPSVFKLGPCVPNPFNPRAEIHYTTTAHGRIQVAVYDVRGRRVRTLVDEAQPAGPHRAAWDGRDDQGRNLPSGVYYVSARQGKVQDLLKVTLLR